MHRLRLVGNEDGESQAIDLSPFLFCSVGKVKQESNSLGSSDDVTLNRSLQKCPADFRRLNTPQIRQINTNIRKGSVPINAECSKMFLESRRKSAGARSAKTCGK